MSARHPKEPPPAPLRDRTSVPDSPNCVTIFGAGIAGLTAAHELVERGFQVQVWEPELDPRFPRRGCDVGGMARTQWSRVHWPEFRIVDHEPLFDEDLPSAEVTPARMDEIRAARPRHGKPTQPIEGIDQKFYVELVGEGEKRKPNVFAALGDEGLYEGADLVKPVRQITDFLKRSPQVQYVYAEICYRFPADKPKDVDDLVRRANVVIAQMRPLLKGTALALGDAEIVAPARSVVVRLGIGDRTVIFELLVLDALPSQYVPEGTDVIVGYRVRERWLPGEHGYRFFPSFYHHLFDTMRRTPILEPVHKDEFAQTQEKAVSVERPEPYRYTETGRTTFDNLQPLTSDLLAFKSGTRPALLSRFRIHSFEEMREWIRVLFSPEAEGGFGIDGRDAVRLMLKILQFLTSAEKRREEYERISWWQFVGGDTLGQAAQDWIQHEPRALVAMDAKSSDARSQGIGITQLVLDQFRPPGYRDGTLKGPTNEAWLNPWRQYLEAQGVEFIQGEIERFEIIEIENEAGKPERRVWPKVACYEPRYAIRDGDEASLPTPDLMPGYIVLAVPPLAARRLAKTYLEELKKAGGESSPGSDLNRMASWADGSLDDVVRNPKEKTPDFRHFVGIQYYFAEDVFWLDGHVYYPDSPWGLTSVSQARFWDERTDWEHGYRGILSVIIGDWDTEGPLVKKKAADCSKDDIAREVWSQIEGAVLADRKSPIRSPSRPASADQTVGTTLPRPLYWHLDDHLVGEAAPLTNTAPFPIAAPGRWEGRPGNVEQRGYEVEHGIVLAGAHLKTFTRLPTMEAANESGRRAVNGILSHTASLHRRTFCDLWNPEDREIDDLRWYKDLDEKLHARGVPHVFDVMGIDELTSELLRGGPNDPLDPVVVWTRVQRILFRLRRGGNR